MSDKENFENPFYVFSNFKPTVNVIWKNSKQSIYDYKDTNSDGRPQFFNTQFHRSVWLNFS